MAQPVISSVVASPATVAPGGASVITVTAFDPDSQIVTVDITVRDQAGNVGSGSVDIQVNDPLTYEASVPAGQGSVVQDPTQPNVFHYTAP
jgi:hypothetical protein